MKLLPKDFIIRNRYKVLRVLGHGGMGAVYLVRDNKEKGTLWAAKEFWCLHEASLFSREASMLMELSHEGLPMVIDYFTENRKNYLIMERIEGLTLERIVEKNDPLTIEKILPWIFQLCSILTYLHTRTPPVIFRDLKPSNIMLDINSKIRLIDFGIARFYEPQKVKDTTPLGTPGYSPPEQYGRGQTSPCSDIYSLGATIYFLLTGKDPSEFKFKFPPLREFNRKVPSTFDKIIFKCLNLNPEKRFITAMELKKTLETWDKEENTFYDNMVSWVTDLLKKEKYPEEKKELTAKETIHMNKDRLIQ